MCINCHYLNQINFFMLLYLIKLCYTFHIFIVIQFGTLSMGFTGRLKYDYYIYKLFGRGS